MVFRHALAIVQRYGNRADYAQRTEAFKKVQAVDVEDGDPVANRNAPCL
jgi:hypothetical protein